MKVDIEQRSMTRTGGQCEIVLSGSRPNLEKRVFGEVYDAGWIQAAAKDKELRRDWTTVKSLEEHGQ